MKDASCHETKEIAEELGISATTLYKYKRMSKEDVENIANIKDYKKGKTLMDDYMNIIFKMLKDEVPQEYIMAYVIKAGYNGSDRYLRDYINIVAKNNGMGFNEYKGFIKLDYPKDVTVITRYELLKYILTLLKVSLKLTITKGRIFILPLKQVHTETSGRTLLFSSFFMTNYIFYTLHFPIYFKINMYFLAIILQNINEVI